VTPAARLTVLSLALAACHGPPPASTAGPVLVEAAPPVVQDVEVTLRYPVEVTAAAKVNVSPVAISGFLTKVLVDVGDRVTRNQLVAEVDCREYAAQRSQTLSAIERWKAQLGQTGKQLERLQAMDDKKLVAAADLDQARLQRDVAQAQLADAEAKLNETTQRLGYCKLKAPFDGWVAERLLDPGEMVRPGGKPVVTIVETRKVRVVVPLLEQDIPKVKPGTEVSISLRASTEPLRGRVSRLGRALDPVSRTLAIEVDLDNRDDALIPGMTGRAAIVTERRPRALIVPVTAVLVLEEGAYVFLVKEGRARRQSVRLGVDMGDWLEIVAGLRGEDTVIVTGRDLVADGTPVQVSPPRERGRVPAQPLPQAATP
jgi:RND family efflux transporter MFP subunit